MKFQRTSKGVTIELDDEECEGLKIELEQLKDDLEYAISLNILSELDEYLGENNE